ncbi:MAG TPA: cell division protein FtsZ [Bryobacteraceae bacterium]|nr:cell division protein FtsZ [Bryobacteraceae bacterium]
MIEDLKYEMEEEVKPNARIRILGIGGCGSNAVAHMMTAGLEGVEFYALNTDFQALESCPVPNKLALGAKLTHGRGAGGDPEVGKAAALDDTERIVEMLQGADLVFLTAGLGAGTGTGATPVVANLAKNLGALTVAIVMKPFSFQGPKYMNRAEQGIEELAGTVDTIIAIPNDRLLTLAPEGTGFIDAFEMGHEFLRQTVQDIVEIMTAPGFVNRDFADLRATMAGSGYAMLATATAEGEHAAVDAARQAISSPLLEGMGIRGATNVLMNFTGSRKLALHDITAACNVIREAAGADEVEINFGLVLNPSMNDSVKVSLIATGFADQTPVFEPLPGSGWLSEQQRAPAAPVPDPEPLPEVAMPRQQPEPPAPPVSEMDSYDDELDRPAIERRRRG